MSMVVGMNVDRGVDTVMDTQKPREPKLKGRSIPSPIPWKIRRQQLQKLRTKIIRKRLSRVSKTRQAERAIRESLQRTGLDPVERLGLIMPSSSKSVRKPGRPLKFMRTVDDTDIAGTVGIAAESSFRPRRLNQPDCHFRPQAYQGTPSYPAMNVSQIAAFTGIDAHVLNSIIKLCNGSRGGDRGGYHIPPAGHIKGSTYWKQTTMVGEEWTESKGAGDVDSMAWKSKLPIIYFFKETAKGPRMLGMRAVSDLIGVVEWMLRWRIDRLGLLARMVGAEKDLRPINLGVRGAENGSEGEIDSHQPQSQTQSQSQPHTYWGSRLRCFDSEIEDEIERIAQLGGPSRTLAAEDLLRRWQDARRIAVGMYLRREQAAWAHQSQSQLQPQPQSNSVSSPATILTDPPRLRLFQELGEAAAKLCLGLSIETITTDLPDDVQHALQLLLADEQDSEVSIAWKQALDVDTLVNEVTKALVRGIGKGSRNAKRTLHKEQRRAEKHRKTEGRKLLKKLFPAPVPILTSTPLE